MFAHQVIEDLLSCEVLREGLLAKRIQSIRRKYLLSGGNGRSIWDDFKLPTELIENEEIRKWIKRRPG